MGGPRGAVKEDTPKRGARAHQREMVARNVNVRSASERDAGSQHPRPLAGERDSRLERMIEDHFVRPRSRRLESFDVAEAHQIAPVRPEKELGIETLFEVREGKIS